MTGHAAKAEATPLTSGWVGLELFVLVSGCDYVSLPLEGLQAFGSGLHFVSSALRPNTNIMKFYCLWSDLALHREIHGIEAFADFHVSKILISRYLFRNLFRFRCSLFVFPPMTIAVGGGWCVVELQLQYPLGHAQILSPTD